MPKFTTISPTHIPGKKEYAWRNFLKGGYIAIGWIGDVDLTGKSSDEVESVIRSRDYDNEESAVQSFKRFLSLSEGDYVAVTNNNHGIFGVDCIKSNYKYSLRMHDSGAQDKDEFYSHYRKVEWIVKSYVPRASLIAEGEPGWQPYGTVGKVYDEVPPFIARLINPSIKPLSAKIDFVRPDFLRKLILTVEELRQDLKHQERAHESLVEDFFVALGYQKHRDIKYRQGRVDLTLQSDGIPLLVAEVKRSWDLSRYNGMSAIKQAYDYAHNLGVRFVLVSNGDNYILFDRFKGLSWESNLICEFQLTALHQDDMKNIERLQRESLSTPDLNELFRNLAEGFVRSHGSGS